MEQPSKFKHLTPEQREQWDRDGYLLIENALSKQEVEELIVEVDRLDEASQRQGRDQNAYLDIVNIVDRAVERSNNKKVLQTEPNEVFLNLIDHPNHLGIVCDLMGAAIQVIVTQVMVRPPSPMPSARWHQDTMAPYGFPIAGGQFPLQQFRIGWFLTDMDQPDMGNFCVIPGSHRNGFPKLPAGTEHALAITTFDTYKQFEQIDAGIPGARQITLKAGDAVVFHNALFHSVARNTSTVRRKNLYYVYSPWWQRLSDRVESSLELLARCNPVRRQLLGVTAEPSAAPVTPADERMPLIRLFEGKSFQETFNDQVASYIRETQQ